MMHQHNIFATQQDNKHALQVQFDLNLMRLIMYVIHGSHSYATIDIINSSDQIDNIFGSVFPDIYGPNNDLYLCLTVDNRVVIEANFKNMTHAQLSIKALECANEIKEAISNRRVNQQQP